MRKVLKNPHDSTIQNNEMISDESQCYGQSQTALPYFPEIYPDELLYSTTARYIFHTQTNDTPSVNRLLFGKHRSSSAYDIPGGLEQFLRIISHRQAITLEKLIMNHTLFPYYTSFRDNIYREKLKSAMASGNIDVVVRRQSYLERPPFLRFCPECQSEMIRNHGEAYWQREHQLPLVHVCHIHRRSLKYSKARVDRSISIYFSATDATCPANSPDIIDDQNLILFQQMIRIADRSVKILQTPPEFQEQKAIRKTYLDALWRKGLMKGGAVLNLPKIRERMNAHFNQIIITNPEIKILENQNINWFSHMMSTHHTNLFPIYHILFQDFLDLQADVARTDQRKVSEKFGNGPWPCFNPIARHNSSPKVRILKECRDGKIYRGRFACECGYIYSRNRDEHGNLSRPRVSVFGKTLRPFLVEAVKAGWSRARTAKTLGISARTLEHQAARLELAGFSNIK